MSTDEKHTEKMKALQAEQKKKTAEARDPGRGLVLVHTGNGKGKSSSAFGVIARALGWGKRVGIVQFIKGKWITGERQFFAKFPEQVTWHTMGEGFTWDTQDKARDIAAAKAGWEKAKALIRDPGIRFVLLDEINIALRYDYLDIAEVLAFLRDEKPPMTHVCLTGRNAKEELIEMADLVTEMTLVKHPFRSGIKGQPGVEF